MKSKNSERFPPLMLITDRLIASQPLVKVVEAALEAGCCWVQIREKDLSDMAFLELAYEISDRARQYHAAVSINGRAHIAACLGADGIHLPQGMSAARIRSIVGDTKIIGVSTHSLQEAQSAVAEGADYITLSPIFPTSSRPGYGPALGLEILSLMAQSVPIPVVALGGVTPWNALDCLRAGAASIAVMGTVMRSSDPGGAVRKYLEAIGKAP